MAQVLPYIKTMDLAKIRSLLKPIKGVILDVDGTLTIPGIFNSMALIIDYRLNQL